MVARRVTSISHYSFSNYYVGCTKGNKCFLWSETGLWAVTKELTFC